MLPLGDIDSVQLAFDESSLLLLNLVIGAIMFGIALDTRPADFREVLRSPVPMAVGVGAQFVLLPAITFGLTLLLGVGASIALGMILVACCPPGNISNVLTYRSGGNVALSVSMTAVSNLLCIFLLPLNLAFWGGLHPDAGTILEEVELDALEMLLDIVMIIGLPFALGILVASKRPAFAKAAQAWVKRVSLVALVAFILIAFVSNFDEFKGHVVVIAVAVFCHDTLALGLGYGIGAAFRLKERDRRAMTFEVGVRNAALGLGLVFTFFDGLGGMAMVAGWWGIWDIIAGLVLAGLWSRRRATTNPPG